MTRFVSISLVGNPNLENPNDERRKKIIEFCQKVAEFDPEFVLKVSPFTIQFLELLREIKLIVFGESFWSQK